MLGHLQHVARMADWNVGGGFLGQMKITILEQDLSTRSVFRSDYAAIALLYCPCNMAVMRPLNETMLDILARYA